MLDSQDNCNVKAWNEAVKQRICAVENLIQVQHRELVSIRDKIGGIADDLIISCDQVSANAQQSRTCVFSRDDEDEVMLSDVLSRMQVVNADLCRRLDLEKRVATSLESKASKEIHREVKRHADIIDRMQRFIDAHLDVDLMDIRRKQDQLLFQVEEQRLQVDENVTYDQASGLISLAGRISSSSVIPLDSSRPLSRDSEAIGLSALRAEILERMTNTSPPQPSANVIECIGISQARDKNCDALGIVKFNEFGVSSSISDRNVESDSVLVVHCMKQLANDLSKLNTCNADLSNLTKIISNLEIMTVNAGLGLLGTPELNFSRESLRDRSHEGAWIRTNCGLKPAVIMGKHGNENFSTKTTRFPVSNFVFLQPIRDQDPPSAYLRRDHVNRTVAVHSEESIHDRRDTAQRCSLGAPVMGKASSPLVRCLSCQATYRHALPRVSTRSLVRAAGFKAPNQNPVGVSP